MTDSPYCPPINPPVPCKEFKMEAVIVCDKYHDFLRETLPHNKTLFDRVVVVTSYEDKETQRVCEFYHVKCVKTDVLQTRHGEFHKAKGINEGLKELEMTGWVAHLDADMWLPVLTREILKRANLDITMVYGIDRFVVKGMKEWIKFKQDIRLQHEAETYIHMDAFPLGTRVMQGLGGYAPIGFFQYWNPIGSNVFDYPAEHGTAARTDVRFAQLWPRAKRGFIPEIIGYHLESVDAHMAANWSGRTTKSFTLDSENPDLKGF
jgi:hypothetical protein